MAVVKSNSAKNQILKTLNEQGYPSYSRLLELFDVYLTDDPNVVGYMLPGKAKMVLNGGLDIDQVSTITRHEILHEYLNHGMRDSEFIKKHPEYIANHDLSNIAADYEISNKGYTDRDKSIARAIRLGDKTLQGLVTEDQYPGWEDMTFEEMYENLLKKQQEDKEELKDLLQNMEDLSQQDMDDLQDDIDNAQQQQSQQQQSQQQKGKQKSKSSQDSQGDSSQDDSQSDSSSSSGDKTDRELDKLSGELDDVQDKLDDINDEKSEAGSPFDTPEQQDTKEDLAERVAKIKDAFDKLRQTGELDIENAKVKRAERQAKEIRKIQTKQSSGLNKFKLNLNKFIDDEISSEEEFSYRTENPSYADTEFLMKGKQEIDNVNIPSINVYWDVSGSFSNPAKTAGAESAINSLQKYVRRGQIVMHTYYFADRVSDTRNGAGGGTNGVPVAEHIASTRPTNVIIITDSDISQFPKTVVPGAAWMLFYDSRSTVLENNLRGRKSTKVYDIDYR